MFSLNGYFDLEKVVLYGEKHKDTNFDYFKEFEKNKIFCSTNQPFIEFALKRGHLNKNDLKNKKNVKLNPITIILKNKDKLKELNPYVVIERKNSLNLDQLPNKIYNYFPTNNGWILCEYENNDKQLQLNQVFSNNLQFIRFKNSGFKKTKNISNDDIINIISSNFIFYTPIPDISYKTIQNYILISPNRIPRNAFVKKIPFKKMHLMNDPEIAFLNYLGSGFNIVKT